ncbi:MAG: transcriptional repressor [Chitinispirillaceae bacterium]|nr:transcriptional repressor [Chitinispirillaceae bacterium]
MKTSVAQQKDVSQIEHKLRKKGISITRQRKRIIAEIMRCGSHFDIESLASRMHVKDHQTARATVYRTVKILTDAGIVKKGMLGETHSHYEFVEQDHGHFVCSLCGKIIELSCPTLENFLVTVSESHNFSIDHHSIELFGICGTCMHNQRKEIG